MARIDKIKEEIGWLKVIFAISIATDISLIAWLVENFGKVKMSLLIVGLIGAFLVTFTIVWIDNTAHRKIDEFGGIVMEWIPITAFAAFLVGLGIVVRRATKK